MATPQTDIPSRATELAADAMDTFCEDISAMFGVDMACTPQDPAEAHFADIKRKYRKLACVYQVKADGVLGGHFPLAFDKEGLFTLAGIIVMQPEQRIEENRKRGTAKEAEDIADAIGEVGNMLVGSWDRIFREGLEGHKHFVQSGTFIGDPSQNIAKAYGLPEDDAFLYTPFEITVGSYSAFNCAALLPKALFGQAEASEGEPPAQDAQEPDAREAPEAAEASADAPAAEQQPADNQAETAEPESAEAQAVQQAGKAEAAATEEAEPAESQSAAESATESAASKVPAEAKDTNASASPDRQQPAEAAGETEQQAPDEQPSQPAAEQRPISETIQKMAGSPPSLPGEHPMMSLNAQVAEVMCRDVLWGTPDDTVEQALARMQQHDTGYMLVGTDGNIEGIVSKSDLAAATSVYLRPSFAQWRRPLDDATLQIRIKWVMSRPVRTVTPETPLATVMQNMCQYAGRCLPVVNAEGKTVGCTTVFDIFKALLDEHADSPTAGKPAQAPAMM